MRSDVLLMVDVQNDFCPGGALPVPNGDEVVEPLNRLAEYFTTTLKSYVLASRDWHPVRTKHFKEFGGQWPAHCIQGTKGAEFHSKLFFPPHLVISKGTHEDEDAYSAFQGISYDGKSFKAILKQYRTRKLFIGGLATDYCVKATVLDALELGFRVVVLEDAIRGVDVNPGDSKRAIQEMRSRGALFTTTDFILNFVS